MGLLKDIGDFIIAAGNASQIIKAKESLRDLYMAGDITRNLYDHLIESLESYLIDKK